MKPKSERPSTVIDGPSCDKRWIYPSKKPSSGPKGCPLDQKILHLPWSVKLPEFGNYHLAGKSKKVNGL